MQYLASTGVNPPMRHDPPHLHQGLRAGQWLDAVQSRRAGVLGEPGRRAGRGRRPVHRHPDHAGHRRPAVFDLDRRPTTTTGARTCRSVTKARAFGDASLGSPTWTDVITNTSDNYAASSITAVPRFQTAFIGPIPWTAPVTGRSARVSSSRTSRPWGAPTGELHECARVETSVAQRNIEIGNDFAAGASRTVMGASGMASITLKTLTGTSNGQPYTPVAGIRYRSCSPIRTDRPSPASGRRRRAATRRTR